jgi:hypothetical protein
MIVGMYVSALSKTGVVTKIYDLYSIPPLAPSAFPALFFLFRASSPISQNPEILDGTHDRRHGAVPVQGDEAGGRRRIARSSGRLADLRAFTLGN